MLAFLLVVVSGTVEPELPRQWAKFSRSGALSHISETVDIATGEKAEKGDAQYVLHLTKLSLGKADDVSWADSATCPAVRSVIVSMRNITMPSPAPYGLPDESITIIADGVGYSLTAPSSDAMGEMTISSNVGSPLAVWVDASFRKLASCWKTAHS